MRQGSRKVVSGMRVASPIRSLANAWDLQLECVRVWHETLLVTVLMTMLWKARYRISAVKMDNLRGLLGIRKMNRVPNARIRELCRRMIGVNKRTDEGVLGWFSHMERMENDRIAKSYVGEYADKFLSN